MATRRTPDKKSTTKSSSSNDNGWIHQACFVAWITALEAMCTDLFGLALGGVPSHLSSSMKSVLFCGNFGILFINKAWTQDKANSELSLQMLKKMVEITMMRGAQSGGVVAWGTDKLQQLYSIRSRVVNSKRTDLSKRLATKVKRDCFSMSGRIKNGIRGFFGHTRFATTSKATFEGTHPHQWSPPQVWRIYHGSDLVATSPESIPTKVENFVTHNGDFDFFRVNGIYHDLHTVQQWLIKATGHPMPATVDSAAIAGVIDIIRCAGSFGLSARFALLLGIRTSKIDPNLVIPDHVAFEQIGEAVEPHLRNLCQAKGVTILQISSNKGLRDLLVSKAVSDIDALLQTQQFASFGCFSDGENGVGSSPFEYTTAIVDAFFDNDLMYSTRYFLDNAKGSFGLMVTSSLDAHRQICIAARGQTMSVALYPQQGIICYGSEQAAVKAGLDFNLPLSPSPQTLKKNKNPFGANSFMKSSFCDRVFFDETLRLDLDDLGGEICLFDWGEDHIGSNMFVSAPHRSHKVHSVLLGQVRIVLHQEYRAATDQLHQRMTRLEGNTNVKHLPSMPSDPVMQDIRDIPNVCNRLQDDWHDKGLNRLTAWYLGRCLHQRLQDKIAGRIAHLDSVDILLTGCEVSLWLAEQFASDLKKSFPHLSIQAISSNKLLGVFGQELAAPSVGYSMSKDTHRLENAIVIIVSHSGGTFAPLACSNLLQSKTDKIFVVASEWDTQIGKQVRSISKDLCSRIFSTDVGVRTAEPCSVSVAATQQLLTLIFQHICLTILGKREFRHYSGAVITETDLKILERCNRESIAALEATVGHDIEGNPFDSKNEKELRETGKVWSQHVLEAAIAQILAVVYIIVSVTIGYPVVTGVVIAIAGNGLGDWLFLTRFFDSLIYWLIPQMIILLLRLIDRRNLRHRMVTRTVVIGDIPWVSQAAEAFLTKIFGCSYSIAGVNVVSGNPTDHLVHRHTQRIVRGTLLICGRPDGRLSALTSAEAAVCLSVNQGSSIQSIGGTCESITIGHNPSSLSLTSKDIFLKSCRPNFLCEQILNEATAKKAEAAPWADRKGSSSAAFDAKRSSQTMRLSTMTEHNDDDALVETGQRNIMPNTSPHFLLGEYTGWKKAALMTRLEMAEGELSDQDIVVEQMIKQKIEQDSLANIFSSVGGCITNKINFDQFIKAIRAVNDMIDNNAIYEFFREREVAGMLDYRGFVAIATKSKLEVLREIDSVERRDGNLQNVESSAEQYFGQEARRWAPGDVSDFHLCESQNLSMELYESRIASLQRFVAMTVMFHEMGKRVSRFFSRVSFGLLGYRMDRTHSILRIATTASPVSAADVRDRIKTLRVEKTIRRSVDLISSTWYNYQLREAKELRRMSHAGRISILEDEQVQSSLRALVRDESNGGGSSSSSHNGSSRNGSSSHFRSSILHTIIDDETEHSSGKYGERS